MFVVSDFVPGVNPLDARFRCAPFPEDPPPDPKTAACDWCGGRQFVPSETGELFDCPECRPHEEG